MASSLQTLVDDIETKLADATVEFAVGRKELYVQTDKRRVVWAWPGGTINSASQAGRYDCSGEAISNLYDDFREIHAHIQAESLEAMDLLHKAVLRAVRDSFTGAESANQPGRYWVPTQQAEAAANMAGDMEYLIQSFVWNMRVGSKEDPDDLTTITQFTHTCDLDPDL